jgi:membrane protein YqaA with SNARE-associated domain
VSVEAATVAAIPNGAPSREVRGLRRWFLFYAVWLTGLCLLALWAQDQHAAGMAHAQKLWLAAVYLFYLSLCCTFFPLPTAWIVMLLASREASLLDAVGWRVLAVTTLGALATGIANLTEYHIWTVALRYRQVNRVRETRLFRWAGRWFHTSPFAVLVGFSFIPLPVDVIRWLAVACRYSRWRFFWAYFLGRWVRYGLLALSTVWLGLGMWHIVGVQAGLIVLAAARFIIAHRSPRADASKSDRREGCTEEST